MQLKAPLSARLPGADLWWRLLFVLEVLAMQDREMNCVQQECFVFADESCDYLFPCQPAGHASLLARQRPENQLHSLRIELATEYTLHKEKKEHV